MWDNELAMLILPYYSWPTLVAPSSRYGGSNGHKATMMGHRVVPGRFIVVGFKHFYNRR